MIQFFIISKQCLKNKYITIFEKTLEEYKNNQPFIEKFIMGSLIGSIRIIKKSINEEEKIKKK
jgi:hypothetical protein